MIPVHPPCRSYAYQAITTPPPSPSRTHWHVRPPHYNFPPTSLMPRLWPAPYQLPTDSQCWINHVGYPSRACNCIRYRQIRSRCLPPIHPKRPSASKKQSRSVVVRGWLLADSEPSGHHTRPRAPASTDMVVSHADVVWAVPCVSSLQCDT